MKIDVAVTESGVELGADSTRVITRFFVPGREDVGPGDSRAAPVIDRILRLDEQTVHETMLDLNERFSHRHRALDETFRTHAGLVTSRLDSGIDLSTERIRLLGASFTHEYAIEGAALCNPSAVLHPHQDGSGDVAFVMSVRGIGEGHRSSIGFRTGKISAAGEVTVDQPGAFPQTSTASAGIHHSSVFHAKLDVLDDDRESAAFVLGPLPKLFVDADLDAGIDDLVDDRATRRNTSTTIANLRSVARSSYRADFAEDTELSERVLWPHAPAESHGMEDARFVRFTDDTGDITYYATYTAFDGANIAQHLLETVDFTTFMVSPMAGEAASGKGLALFPRMVGGRYAALSRSDRETNAIAFSDDLRCWQTSELIQVPERSWELLQLGNCGSPIETKAGWLALTHGVGPMRTYSLGAILLDIDDPRQVLARSSRPIITPGNDRRDGYVPNVVYTCGGFAHNDTLVLPFGIGDQRISVVTLSIDELLSSLQPEV